MSYNTPNTRRSFWDTPRGAAQLHAAHAQLLDRLRAPESTSSGRAHAWAQYRQERFTETKLERLTGTDAVYHWSTDYARPLGASARALVDHFLYPTPREKVAAALPVLEHVLGYRWKRGIDGLNACLDQRGTVEQQVIFMAESRAFEARAAALLDAVDTLSREGQWDAAMGAIRTALHAALDEAGRAVHWLEHAEEHGIARLLRDEAQLVSDALRGEASEGREQRAKVGRMRR